MLHTRSWVRHIIVVAGMIGTSGCAMMERSGSGGMESSGHNPELAILAEADEFELGYVVTDMEGNRRPGQVLSDGESTYFAWPRNKSIDSVQTAHGQAINVERIGPYYVADRVEGMWFVTTGGEHWCVRDDALSADACSDRVDASSPRPPDEDELMQRRQELEARLRALEEGAQPSKSEAK